ncbi:MAG: 3-deoxy-manno-octulosonate cytidylyltransferase [Alphaproteobacteria bacterium MarineAlpha11_Bin1]|nr:MAG: 3-deoxy-manno-octulosonate cytidylyltransferase [Alphaproteobacteria bacterium MarineAlpha11_Bin1]|tara:strand:- start:2460 stop:3218 length:759 start_codon:yes stop_codon:yes gene_type:complete
MQTTLNPVIVIPARLAATRFPDKPLADIDGDPMIVHVWRRAVEAGIAPVLVAAGDQLIVDAVLDAGGNAVITDPGLPSGSDRVHQALKIYDPNRQYDTVINVQGDLPTIESRLITAVLGPFEDPDVDIATLAVEISEDRERTDPNVVKVVIALKDDDTRVGRALYFSRATIPHAPYGPHYHHIGLYCFRREALDRFVSIEQSNLERQERLEQLRALEVGMRVDVALVDTVPVGVDTPEDLDRVRNLLSGGPP